MMRERELQVALAEYTFLSMCGGISEHDVARLRASVCPPPVVIKIEDDDAPKPVYTSGFVSLKSVIRDLLVGSGPTGETQLNALCRRVRGVCGNKLTTYQRHNASHVRVGDIGVVRNGLAMVMRERLDGWGDGGMM